MVAARVSEGSVGRAGEEQAYIHAAPWAIVMLVDAVYEGSGMLSI
jgi:hypothetical protein